MLFLFLLLALTGLKLSHEFIPDDYFWYSNKHKLFNFMSVDMKANLLLNGSFEEYEECPDEPGQLYLGKSWSIPNKTTPDFFHSCQTEVGSFGIPYNYKGHQIAHSGNAYCGLVIATAKSEFKDYREYIQGELSTELIKGRLYDVSFYLNWSGFSNYFCNKIGYLFLNNELNGSHGGNTKRKKKVRTDSGKKNTIIQNSHGVVDLDIGLLSDRNSWHRIEIQYQAKGRERFIILGLFGDNFNEEEYQQFCDNRIGFDASIVKERNWEGAYYFIDSISITESDFSHQ